MKNKSQVFIWSLFDFGNSSYATIIVAFVFAVYFKEVISSGQSIGDLYWSVGINISMIIAAILNPVCGAIADIRSNKKKFLFFFTMLCVVSTSLMYFTKEGTILFAIFLFIMSNIGFQTGLTFYEAFITEIAEPDKFNKVSAMGYAVGYIGSLISVILVFPFKDNPNILFVISAVFFLIFSMPLFLFLKEKKIERVVLSKGYVSYGFAKVMNTVRNINKYRNLKNYLIAYLFYIDAVNTIIFFAGNYASSTLKFTITELAVFFLIVQITAMLGSFLFGFIGDRIGILKSIYVNLIMWSLLTIAVFFTNDKMSFFIIGGFAGTFLGSTQSLSRALMATLTPEESKTEFFGFYGLFDKTSTLLGPLTFGMVSYFTGSQKFAVLSLGIFFLLGMFLLKNVKEKEILQ
ncbi:MAG: MFS transporter [bacterium]